MSMKFVFNQKGFLLLEHLIAIAITGIISIAFLSVMQVISGYTVDQNALTMHEVNTVAVRIQNEIRFADLLTVSTGRLELHFERSNEIISFFILNDRLVRRVNGRGGEVLIYSIASMDVVSFGAGAVRVELRCLSGDTFSFSVSKLQLDIDFAMEEIEDDYEYENKDLEEGKGLDSGSDDCFNIYCKLPAFEDSDAN